MAAHVWVAEARGMARLTPGSRCCRCLAAGRDPTACGRGEYPENPEVPNVSPGQARLGDDCETAPNSRLREGAVPRNWVMFWACWIALCRRPWRVGPVLKVGEGIW